MSDCSYNNMCEHSARCLHKLGHWAVQECPRRKVQRSGSRGVQQGSGDFVWSSQSPVVEITFIHSAGLSELQDATTIPYHQYVQLGYPTNTALAGPELELMLIFIIYRPYLYASEIYLFSLVCFSLSFILSAWVGRIKELIRIKCPVEHLQCIVGWKYACAEGGPRLPIAHALRLLFTQKWRFG